MSTVVTDIGCLHELFEAQVDLRPDEPALICGEESFSYQELEDRSNQLARYLRAHGAGPGKLVGLYFERSEKPIVAILATLKSGAGYVPIDPAYPADRAKHILTEAAVTVVLTEQRISAQLSAFFPGRSILVDGHAGEIAKQSTARLDCQETGVSPEDLCYVLYTSGTTGRPKGIMTEHRNVVQFASAFNEVCQIQTTDRVYQGFALGFDGSVEEMWMALSNGATLVVGTSDAARLGNEVAQLFTEKKITIFSTVPTFLSMIQQDLPTVRLIIVSGEPCPKELVQKWARPGRRMLNVYGPTETTVNTTATECWPDQPVTIGRPLRGYETHILNEKMQLVSPGEPGELYIGGVGLARGYFSQPELTHQQFVPNPLNGRGISQRLYRTGDLVSLTDDGDLLFLGRIDQQVKIRGYRIELSEIESVLREHPMVHQAVVNVHEREGLKELAAYVVTDRSNGFFDRDDVLRQLRNRLPAYMIPGYLDVIDTLPTLASGKADRKRLPEPATPLVTSNRTIVAPCNEIERKIAEVWEKVLKVSPISIDDDFFLDLAGYSLLAAQMVSQLRNEHDLEVAIRDVYTHPTIRQFAEHVEASVREAAQARKQPQRRSSREVFQSLSRLTRWSCIGLQAATLMLSYGVVSITFLLLILLILAVIQETVSLATLIIVLIALIFFSLPLMISFSIAVKWLIIGRYKPGEYPVWSFYYFRWWLATRVQALSVINLYSGTPLMSLYYRLMGAKVGKNCILDTPLCAIFDLVTIGDDTCIGSMTQLLGYRVEDGMLIIGSIEIGSRCFIGNQCALAINTKMEDDTRLDDLSLLPDGEVMASGQSRRGSPAQPAEVSIPKISEQRAARRRPFLFGLLHFIAAEVIGELMLLSMLPILLMIILAFHFGGILWTIGAVFIAIPLGMVLYCLVVAGIKALILRRVKPGVYPVESWFFLRKWMVDVLMQTSSGVMYTLYTTIYLPPWLRMLGAKIGKRAEISAVTQMSADLTVIGDESFCADGAVIGGRRLFRGHVQLEINRIGRRSFVGNNSLLPVGANLGDNCLLGVLSAPPGAVQSTTPDGTEWLGSPSFRLPYRQKVEGIDISGTYRPTVKLYILRYLIDAMRIMLPPLIATVGLILYILFVVVAWFHLPLWTMFVLSPIVGMGIMLGAALSVVVIKRLLMGTFKPTIKPLWSVYVWLNETVNGVYETVGAPILAPMLGTPFFCWYLRLMGCKIGKHVFMETTFFSEYDLVDIGDYAALNMEVVVQNHLFEDRIMKSSYLRIGDECSVGNMSVVLYDTEMKQGSSIAPLSLLMKGETLPPGSRWIGIPTSQIKESVES